MDKVGMAESGSHASIITFSNKAKLNMKFDEIYDFKKFETAVNALTLAGGNTRIDLALNLAKDKMFVASNGARASVQKLLVLMTDGSQTKGYSDAQNPADVAKELRDMGINVLVIGIGSGINAEELSALAGGKHWHFADSFAELVSARFIERISRATCDIGKKHFVSFCILNYYYLI